MEYRSLMAQFSKIKGYKGYVIIKVKYERVYGEDVQKIVESCREKKRRKDYGILEAVRPYRVPAASDKDGNPLKIKERNGYERMEMQVVKPLHSLKAGSEKSVEPAADAKWIEEKRGYTETEVLDFVEEVKDLNPIHRDKEGIVPGLFILEQLLLEKTLWKEGKVPNKLEVLYRAPLFIGEDFILYQTKKKSGDICLSGWSKGEKQRLLFELLFSEE